MAIPEEAVWYLGGKFNQWREAIIHKIVVNGRRNRTHSLTYYLVNFLSNSSIWHLLWHWTAHIAMKLCSPLRLRVAVPTKVRSNVRNIRDWSSDRMTQKDHNLLVFRRNALEISPLMYMFPPIERGRSSCMHLDLFASLCTLNSDDRELAYLCLW